MMLTENNHFQYGRIIEEPDVFFAKLGQANLLLKTPFEEAVIAAHKIKKAAQDQKIKLCVSGGVDSEVMLRSFIHAEVDFEVHILRFKDNLNDFDIFNVIEFCQKRNIVIHFLDLDVIRFFESGQYLKYGELYQCQSPQLAVHLWMLDQMDGFPVLSGNYIFPKKMEDGFFYVGLPGELHCVYFRYFEKKQRAGVPWFLIYTPELYTSFFKTPTIQKQFQLSFDHQMDFDYALKCQIYNEGGFDVLPREDKFTGFEKIRAYYDQKMNSSFGMAFDELYRKPLEIMNPFPNEFLQLVPDFNI